MPDSNVAIEPATEPRPMPTPRGRASLLGRLQLGRFSGLWLWALVIAVFAVWTPATFLTDTTFKTIAGGQAITGILALAILLPLAAGAFDLSAAQNVGFSALLCGALMTHEPQLGIAAAIVVTLAAGAAIGAFNGALVAWVGVDSFIATLGTSSLLLAGSQIIAEGQFIGPFAPAFTDLTSPSVLGVPIVAVYLLVLAVVMWYVLEHTPVGRRIFATGANRDAARLAGIPTRRLTFWSLTVGGMLAAAAGVLLASTLNTVNETLGPQYLLPAFAAAFLGTTQIKPGWFNVWGTIVAIYLLGTGVQGLQLVGGSAWVTNLFNGAALIGAVSIAILIERRRDRSNQRRADARRQSKEAQQHGH